MKLYNTFITAVPMMIVLCTIVSAQEKTIEMKVNDLLSKMTIEEKIGQMVQYSGSDEKKIEYLKKNGVGSFLNVTGAENTNKLQKIAVEQTRLGIPIIFGLDVIHGYRTITPIPLAEACGWDVEMVQKSAAMAAKEARASGVSWTFGPMVDITREPRWGRIAEGSGEDPFLGSEMAIARVKGFQGSDVSSDKNIAACLKHYVGYGASEAGKDYNNTEISERTLRNLYLPPFRAGVREGALTVMSAYMAISGVPATGNRHTITEILKQEWGFDGFVVSDWSSVKDLITHGFAENEQDAGAKALYAGVDMDMEGHIYSEVLPEMVKQGKVPESEINEAVRRILTVKFKLGLFDNPYTDPSLEKNNVLTKENNAVAREMAVKSIVLLKNDKNILPLKKTVKSIALIGPLADSKVDMLGMWCCLGKPEDAVTVLGGIKGKLPGVKINYAQGCDVKSDKTAGFAAALTAARNSEVVVMVLGESADMSGEANSRTAIGIPGKQEELLKEVYKTGKPVVLVLMNGRPLTINWEAENIPAIVEAWHLGVQSGNAIADVLFGDYNPSGRLVITFPRNVGQIPIYYNHESTCRPPSADKYSAQYIDSPYTPLYPFGYGLSYTKFDYSGLKLSADKISRYGTITVSAEISNSGKVAGEETVQLYIRDRVASLVRPIRELKGFKKVSLNPGEKKTVEFTIGPEELGFYNTDSSFIVEPGDFDVWIGHDSTSGLQGTFKAVE